ncbi:Alpha/Beta hydrolase protein [Triangularia setosa]|uniref:Alpha/Beta hydrolase protein n=1 Tax=Triangularia setosa TaxID=2587417 RepID=A0AAN6W541_9PEZI|nr:Alpha/Beta hydrolase protein [Podospora setosa]
MNAKSGLAKPYREFIAELGEAPHLTGSTDETKQQWGVLIGKMMQRYGFPPPDPTVISEPIQFGDISVRTYTPIHANSGDTNLPLGVYFHGGGFVMGSVEQEDGFTRALSNNSRMRIVSVGYRLAPEFKFPTGLGDGMAAAVWALNHFGAGEVTLMGTSSGGNLAFGVGLRLIERGMRDKVRGVVALAPVTVHPDAVPMDKREGYTSYEENSDYTVNSKSAMLSWLGTYGGAPEDPYLSVLLHPRLGDLKRVYMTESGADTLRDDARLMKDSLEEAGVAVMYDAYPGYPHYSWLFPCKSLAEHQKVFWGNMLKGIHWVASE